MTGKQLDCCTLAAAKSEEAEVGLADGAMAPAALAQSAAAKRALGGDSDAELGQCHDSDHYVLLMCNQSCQHDMPVATVCVICHTLPSMLH